MASRSDAGLGSGLSCASCYAEAVIMPNCEADSLVGAEFGLSCSA
jgi:hypothetical protein